MIQFFLKKIKPVIKAMLYCARVKNRLTYRNSNMKSQGENNHENHTLGEQGEGNFANCVQVS